MANNAINVDITKSPVTCNEINVGQFQKSGTKTAVLRQSITSVSTYPSAVHEHDFQDNLFANDAFGDEDGQTFTNTEKRVAFLEVPANQTVEKVQALLKNTPKAALYKVLSNAPILTSNHTAAIKSGRTTKDIIGDSQVVRYGENDDNAGNLITDENNQVQYRKVFFMSTGADDIDKRYGGSEPYSTPSIVAELAPSKAEANFELANEVIED